MSDDLPKAYYLDEGSWYAKGIVPRLKMVLAVRKAGGIESMRLNYRVRHSARRWPALPGDTEFSWYFDELGQPSRKGSRRGLFTATLIDGGRADW